MVYHLLTLLFISTKIRKIFETFIKCPYFVVAYLYQQTFRITMLTYYAKVIVLYCTPFTSIVCKFKFQVFFSLILAPNIPNITVN